MPRALKYLGIALIVLGGFGVASFLITFMAIFPYLIANEFGDAGLIVLVFLLYILVSAAIVALGMWLRKKAIRMEEDAWRANLPDNPTESYWPEPAGSVEVTRIESAPTPAPTPTPVAAKPIQPTPRVAARPAAPSAPREPEQPPFQTPTVSTEHQRTYAIKRDQINLAQRPELVDFNVPFDHKVAATIALALEDCGYHMTRLGIGGGSDEVSHTGAVAYGGHYDNLQDFIQTAPENYRKAEEHATELYGTWFTGLNWFYIVMSCKRGGSRVTVDISNICKVTITWEFDSADGIDEEVAAVKAALCADQA